MNGSGVFYQENVQPFDPLESALEPAERNHVQTASDAAKSNLYDEELETDSDPAPLDLGLALDLPSSELDLDITAIIGPSSTSTTQEQTAKVQKRASNVLKLSQEHERLKEELRAMTERLEAAERKQNDFMARAKGGASAGKSN